MFKVSNISPIDYIAIDVSKASLQAQDDQHSFAVYNDSKLYLKLLNHLKTRQNPLIVLEASGSYERGLCEFLHKKAVPLAMVNPACILDLARSRGVRSKT